MNEKQIALLPPYVKPVDIKTIYTFNGHCHGGMSVTSVVVMDGKELDHTRRDTVISYEDHAGLVKLGRMQ